MTLQLLCLDPGFASVGYATLVFHKGAQPFVDAFGIIRTAKSDKKQKVLAVEDNLRRTMQIACTLRMLAAVHRTVGICAEGMSFPRSSSVAAKMALIWGAMASLSEAAMIPILQATPMQVKQAVTGIKTATKDEVIEAVEKLYPEILPKRRDIPRGQWEHPHDALAVGHMMLSSDVVRMARLAG